MLQMTDVTVGTSSSMHNSPSKPTLMRFNSSSHAISTFAAKNPPRNERNGNFEQIIKIYKNQYKKYLDCAKTQDKCGHQFQMANKKAARKSMMQAVSHTERNKAIRSKLKTLSRKVSVFMQAGSDEARRVAIEFVSELDKAVKKSVIHRNAANRKKGFLSKVIFV
jgi:small subunit ribosomal protein S20